jgi:hypothetical protein
MSRMCGRVVSYKVSSFFGTVVEFEVHFYLEILLWTLNKRASAPEIYLIMVEILRFVFKGVLLCFKRQFLHF